MFLWGLRYKYFRGKPMNSTCIFMFLSRKENMLFLLHFDSRMQNPPLKWAPSPQELQKFSPVAIYPIGISALYSLQHLMKWCVPLLAPQTNELEEKYLSAFWKASSLEVYFIFTTCFYERLHVYGVTNHNQLVTKTARCSFSTGSKIPRFMFLSWIWTKTGKISKFLTCEVTVRLGK